MACTAVACHRRGGPVETHAETVSESSQQPELVIGLLASPGPASELTQSLVGEIADRLAGQLPGARWRVEFVSDRLVEPPTGLSELIAAGRRMLLERGWHLAVCVTDLPLQTARRPVIAHVSASHGVAVLSMPALGPVAVRKRTVETIVRLVGHMLGDLAPAADAAPLARAVTRRMRELGGRARHGEHGVGFVARVITGNIWLLLGMLRANRPWRLALRLMRALAVAFAAGVFALVTSDIWRLSHYLGPLRLTVIALGSVAGITVTIVAATGLWEHSPHRAAREQVALFNIVTTATVGLGVATLYLALFAIMLAATLLLVPGNLLGLVLGRPAGVAGQVSLAWLATSIATLGGALGAALESGETVREAAYTYQPDTEIDAVAGPRLRAARLSGPPGTLHIWGIATCVRCAMVAGDLSARGDDHVDTCRHPRSASPAATHRASQRAAPAGDWIRHHSLRSWPVLLFLLLICVPSIALYILGPNPSASTFDHVAWIFAAYFAVAWLLLLGVIIRPAHVTRPMLVLVTVIALATQVPLAVTLEVDLHASTAGLGPSIYSVGVPEELAKTIPVLAVVLIYRLWLDRRWGRHELTPRDCLFLGAVSGLAFGASEVVHYFTVNGIVEFYLVVQSALPSIQQLILSGHSAPDSVFAVLIGPVRYFILDFVWRFLTDPITHACWSGLSGYFIGLAVSGRHKWYTVGWIGLAAAAILHGLNDWSQVNGHLLWIFVTLVSGILFLGYAKVGSRGDEEAPEIWPRAFGRHGLPARHAAGEPAGHRPWWEH